LDTLVGNDDESSIRNGGKPSDRRGSLGRLRGRRFLELPESFSLLRTGFMILLIVKFLLKFLLLQVKFLFLFEKVSR